MGKITWKGGTFVYPLPAVMVSCGDMKNANIITVAWTGIINTNPAMCYISVRPERFSSGIIKKNKEEIKYMLSGLMIQFTNHVINRPLGFFPMSLILLKSIFNIIG